MHQLCSRHWNAAEKKKVKFLALIKLASHPFGSSQAMYGVRCNCVNVAVSMQKK